MELPISPAAASIRSLARTQAETASAPSSAGATNTTQQPRLAEAQPRQEASRPRLIPADISLDLGVWLIAGALIAIWLIFSPHLLHLIDVLANEAAR